MLLQRVNVLINYSIRPFSISNRLFECELRFEHRGGGVELRLPNWIPGSYLVRDFSRHIHQIAITLPNSSATISAVEKDCWRLEAPAGEVRVSLISYANDLSVRECYLDDQRAFFNPTSLCLRVAGQADQPHAIHLDSEHWPQDWRVASGMPRSAVDSQGMGSYCASSFTELCDYPFELGDFLQLDFDLRGIPHHVVLSGSMLFDQKQLLDDLSAICASQLDFFAQPSAVSEYWFLINVVTEGYGGLEHLNSTALIIARDKLPHPNDPSRSEGYLNFLGLCSHEYFHTWNVKRIRPAELIPYDFNGPQYTRMLWFAEGVTSYYDELFLLRAGIVDSSAYFDSLAKTITRVQRAPGAAVQTLLDASFMAWTKFYQQDENAPNTLASYYQKGALLSLCLDLSLRQESGGKSSLDTLMQAAWAEANRPGYLGISLAWIEAYLGDHAALKTAKNLRFWLQSPGQLPLEQLLDGFDIDLEYKRDHSREAYIPQLGVYVETNAKIRTVLHASAAAAAGLASGDEIVAIDGLRRSRLALHQYLSRLGSGQVEVVVFRHDRLLRLQLEVQPLAADAASLVVRPSADLSWLMAAAQ